MSYQFITVVTGKERPRGWTVRIAGITWCVPEAAGDGLIVIPQPLIRADARKVAA